MAQDYTEYLAITVLNEQQPVSYRTLSRALKVHSNLAKQMLYEFHRKQNAKKPGSVHATYLLTGTKATPSSNGLYSQDDQDSIMQSSPFLPSSSALQPETAGGVSKIRSVMVVKEEHLDQAKAVFETLSSIHIYSLEANGLSDIQVLTDCNRKVAASYASEDPLLAWKQYGTIQNPNVRRRKKGTGPPPAAPTATAKVEASKSKASAATTAKSGSKETSSTVPAPEPGEKPPLKPLVSKRQNSDIFKSFAKGKTKAPAEASPAAESQDVPMNDFSDDDAADDETPPEPEADVPAGKSKKEREAELQAMMEQEDDEPMEDAPEQPAAEEETQEEPEAAIDKTENKEADTGPKESVTIENGRRRGKRRVMKKKTVKDEEGYLVTKEDWVWESFSEDEPAPKKIKVPPAPTNNNAGGKGAAKKGGKPGQGNIMSFFSKK